MLSCNFQQLEHEVYKQGKGNAWKHKISQQIKLLVDRLASNIQDPLNLRLSSSANPSSSWLMLHALQSTPYVGKS